MKHLLMDPAFPDLVAEWAETGGMSAEICGCANDNEEEGAGDFADPMLMTLAKLEIAASRLW